MVEKFSKKEVKDYIRQVWHRLSEKEVAAHEGQSEIFYLAVRKKHGVEPSQAKRQLNELEQRVFQAA